MKKFALLFLLVFIFISCGEKQGQTVMQPLVERMQDGYVGEWNGITAVPPPPPAPFRFMGGNPIDLGWVSIVQTGPAAQVEVDFFVAMGAVGNIHFGHIGSAPAVATSTPSIENALNSWNFSNNASGQIILKLNFGKNEAEIDFSGMQLLNGVKVRKQSFYSAFQGGQLK